MYSHISCILLKFYHISPSVGRCWKAWHISILYYLFYHLIRVCLPLVCAAGLVCLLRLWALNYYLTKPVDISNVIEAKIGTCSYSELYNFNIIINIIIYMYFDVPSWNKRIISKKSHLYKHYSFVGFCAWCNRYTNIKVLHFGRHLYLRFQAKST